MIQVIRYLKGYLTIRVWGFSPERFMNLCSHHNLFLWDIVNCGEYYTMKISLKGFYRLRTIARKTGTRVVITKRCGLPFLSVKMWRRRIFFAGLLGSLLFWIWMSGFIWTVEIQGNYYVTEDVFFDFLAEQEIQAGMKKKAVNIEELEKAVRNRFNMVTWTSAQINGTRLIIQIKENERIDIKQEENGESQEGKDLVAEKDGTVVSIITRNGVPKVTAGAEVKKGDILVEGGVPIWNDDATVKRYMFCEADADIVLRCSYRLEEEIQEVYEQKNYSGREKKTFFVMAGNRMVKFPFWKREYDLYDKIEEKRQLKLFENYYLPVYVGHNRIREYETEEKIYSKDEIKALFEQKIQNFVQTLQEKGVQIIEKNVTIKKTSGRWKMKVDFQAEELTGIHQKTQLMQVQETAEETDQEE